MLFVSSGTIDAGELKQAMESLGYKQKNKMVYQMIENLKHKEINFDQFLDMMTARIVRKNTLLLVTSLFQFLYAVWLFVLISDEFLYFFGFVWFVGCWFGESREYMFS